MTTQPTLANAEATSPEVEKRIFIFCPGSPEEMVWLGGRGVQFRNGRLVSDKDGLTDTDVGYFVRKMNEAIERSHEPTYYVWGGPIGDPTLRAMLEPRVTQSVLNGGSASEPAQVTRGVAIRMAMMLAHPDGDNAPIEELLASSQDAIFKRMVQSVHRGTTDSVFPSHAAPVAQSGLPVDMSRGAPVSQAQPGPSTEQLEAEQAIIQRAHEQQQREDAEDSQKSASPWE